MLGGPLPWHPKRKASCNGVELEKFERKYLQVTTRGVFTSRDRRVVSSSRHLFGLICLSFSTVQLVVPIVCTMYYIESRLIPPASALTGN
jgi:hypothetical protein